MVGRGFVDHVFQDGQAQKLDTSGPGDHNSYKTPNSRSSSQAQTKKIRVARFREAYEGSRVKVDASATLFLSLGFKTDCTDGSYPF